jgi:hypothetical protein
VLAGIVVFRALFAFYDRFYDKSDSAELIAEPFVVLLYPILDYFGAMPNRAEMGVHPPNHLLTPVS